MGWLVSEKEKNEAIALLKLYEQQQRYQIRGTLDDDCPTREYEYGVPNGKCEGDGHWMCKQCINYDDMKDKMFSNIQDISKMLGQLDYDESSNSNNTISLELENNVDQDELYFHIEIGLKNICWQYRVNGNRVVSEDYVSIEDIRTDNDIQLLKSCILDFPLMNI